MSRRDATKNDQGCGPGKLLLFRYKTTSNGLQMDNDLHQNEFKPRLHIVSRTFLYVGLQIRSLDLNSIFQVE